MPFGQIVIGPPGSGKSTYCAFVSAFLQASGRDICIVNLDPANDALPYRCDVDLADLISLDEVQEQMGLGPNGGLVYCLDYLEKNTDWLQEQLAPHVAAGRYLLFDCPGQAELYMCHDNFRAVVNTMTKEWHFNLTMVQLVDSHLCTDPHKYLSALLMCLSSMLHLELPHVNVLTKVDLLERMHGEVLDVEQLTDVRYLQRQLEQQEMAFSSRFARLSEGLCEVADSYGLLALTPLAVERPEAIAALLDLVDQANGYSFSGLQGRDPYAAGREAGEAPAALPKEEIWTRTDSERTPQLAHSSQ